MVLIIALACVVKNSFGYSPEIRCNWNCSVDEADLTGLTQEMETSTSNKKVIKLGVRYQKMVDDKCANETSVSSSEYDSEYCQICLVNKRFFSSMTANKSLVNEFLSSKHREIRAICTLKPARTTVASPKNYISRSSAICHLTNIENEFDSIDYHVVKVDLFGPRMNITIPDWKNSTKGPKVLFNLMEWHKGHLNLVEWLKGALNLKEWPKMVSLFFSSLFIAVFMSYSLAFLCLFYPTEILQDGVTHIILEGASPVSLRSFVGNYFFSGKEGIWCKAKTFILRAFIIPLPFLVSASTILAYFENDAVFKLLFNKTLFIVSASCYCFRAFYVSFSGRFLVVERCFSCEFLKPAIFSCHDELPRKIMNHLRLQPLILVECCRFYKRRLLDYFKISVTLIPSCRCSIVFAVRLVLVISLLLCTPVVAIGLLVIVSLFGFIGIALSAPAAVLCVVQCRPSIVNSKILIILFKLIHGAVSAVSLIGTFQLLLLATYGALNALVGVFLHSFSEEYLPYVVCFVFVLYYIWSSYSSFTKTYHELALTLYDCYKDLKRTQLQDVPSTSDQLPNLPHNTHDLDNLMAIPRELFEMACEELSPLREGVCTLILKIAVLVSSVFFVFSLAMVFSFDKTPLMKTLLTFLTLSFPKIVAIYINGGWRKKLQAMVMKEKVPKIVEKFISETSTTTRGQRDRDANVDEVILVNEENSEPTIM